MEKSANYFKNGFNCSQVVLAAFASDFGLSKEMLLAFCIVILPLNMKYFKRFPLKNVGRSGCYALYFIIASREWK